MLTRRSLLTRSGLTLLGTAGACFALAGDNPFGGAPPEFLPDGSQARGMITDATDTAIDRGLEYLAAQQRGGGYHDGSYGSFHFESSVAITSLAGLAFMAAGYQPNRGLHGKCVTRALQFLLRQGQGQPPGYLHSPGANLNGAMYGHGFGTLFLAEACGMVHDKQLRLTAHDRLKQAVQVILGSQNHEGGWRYNPFPNEADLSVTVCQMMALRSARNAGIGVPSSKVSQCIQYVKKCQTDEGSFRYQLVLNGRGSGNAFARTAAGVSALNSAGIYLKDADGATVREIERGLEYMLSHRPSSERFRGRGSDHYFYGHYYAVQAMWTAGGKYWAEWYPYIRDELLRTQRADGSWADAIDAHYATAMACIILQVPNNYLPILQK